MERKQCKVYQGRVVSDKMDKTITVVTLSFYDNCDSCRRN